jgi:hypothetical protein
MSFFFGIETRFRSRLWFKGAVGMFWAGSEPVGDALLLGARLVIPVNTTDLSSSCNSRKRGFAAYSSKLENVSGDKNACSSTKGPGPSSPEDE